MSTTASQPSADKDASYLAQPSGPCCLRGTLHEGTPRGRRETIAGLESYVTEPPEGVQPNGNVILYFPDVWGFFTNGLLVMDAFADAGYLVLGIEYFRGVSLSLLWRLVRRCIIGMRVLAVNVPRRA